MTDKERRAAVRKLMKQVEALLKRGEAVYTENGTPRGSKMFYCGGHK